MSEQPDLWRTIESKLSRQIEFSKLLEKIEQQRNAHNLLVQNEDELNKIFSSQVSHGEVRVTGNNMTQADFIRDEFDIPFPCTVQEAGMAAYEALEGIHNELDIIESANLIIDIDEDDPFKLTLDVDLKEKNRITAAIGAQQDVDSLAQVHGTFNVGIRNIFGRGERLDVQSDTGLSTKNEMNLNAIQNSSSAFSIVFQKPRIIDKHCLIVKASKESVDRSQCSSYREDSVGGAATIVSSDKKQALSYNCTFRSLIPVGRNSPLADPQAPMPVSASVGDQIVPNLKSSLIYRFLQDDRIFVDSLPVGGAFASTDIELAGLGGDVDFIKAFSRYQYHKAIPSASCIFNFGMQSGALVPWKRAIPYFANNPSSCSQHTQIIDRFIPPGGLLLRGFEPGQSGPRDGNDFVHADYILNAGMSLTFPVFSWMNFHMFGNGMLSGLWQYGMPSAKQLSETARASVGASLVFPFPVGRLEIGYAHPVKVSRRDPFSHLFWAFDVSFF